MLLKHLLHKCSPLKRLNSFKQLSHLFCFPYSFTFLICLISGIIDFCLDKFDTNSLVASLLICLIPGIMDFCVDIYYTNSLVALLFDIREKTVVYY